MLLYTSGTSGRPRAAMLSHRALLANIEQAAAGRPADDPRQRRGASGCCRCSTSTASTPCSARCCATRRGWCWSTASTPRTRSTSSRTRRSPCCRSRRRCSPTGEPSSTSRTGSAASGWRCPARRRSSAELIDVVHRAPPGIEVHQGYGLTEAAPVVTSTLCSKHEQPGSVGAALPGVEIRLVDEPGRAPEGDDPGEIWVRGDEPVHRLLARRRRRPRRRAAGTPPATSASSTRRRPVPGRPAQGAGDRLRVQRLPERGRGGDRRGRRGGRGGRDRRRRRAHRRGGGRLRQGRAAGADPRPELPTLVQRALRAPAGPVQAAVAWSTSSTELPHTVTGKVAKGRLRATERRRALGLLE